MRTKLLALALAATLPITPTCAAVDAPLAARVDGSIARSLPDLLALYRDLHQHPEIAFQEQRTAALLARQMRALGFTVSEHVGKTGLVAVLKNGAGPTVMVRTELDALPMEEKTGLLFASKAQATMDGKSVPVDHACGHDIHMAWWVGTAEALLATKERWHGTLVFVAQPAEEIISGAKAMLADGLFTRFPRPDYGFAAHVGPDPAGTVAVKQGVTSSASDTVLVTFHGVGAHGSMPDKSIDPVVQGARFVEDVQTIVAREKDPKAFGVVTVGAFNAGTVANIIPDHADLQLTIRAFDPAVRTLLNEGVDRTAKAVAAMARAPAPDIGRPYGTGPVVNDEALAARAAEVLRKAFPANTVTLSPASAPGGSASEDYSEFVTAGVTRSVYFAIGGTPPATIARARAENKTVPGNHSPFFAPDPDASIRAGVKSLTLAVLMVAGG